jgi:hypothetical protein
MRGMKERIRFSGLSKCRTGSLGKRRGIRKRRVRARTGDMSYVLNEDAEAEKNPQSF